MGPVVVHSSATTIHALGMERLHPFDLRKYRRAWSIIRRRAPGVERVGPEPVDLDACLRLVHTDAYLASLKRADVVAGGVEVAQLARLPGVVLDRILLRPMRVATRGTITALRLAAGGRSAINLGGGFHHACPDNAQGFCIYADAAVAIRTLRWEGVLGAETRILVIDLDAHMGNGFARCVADDPSVRICDFFNGAIYPRDVEAVRRIDTPVAFLDAYGGPRYLAALDRTLPSFLDEHHDRSTPTIAIYNAGSDVYEGDRLGGFGLSFEDVLTRDRTVIGALDSRAIPWVMLPSGGYSEASHRLIAETAVWALGRTGRG